jgi:hypothetical protein
MTFQTLRLIGAITIFAFSGLADDGHRRNDNNGNNGNNSTFEASVIGSNPGLGVGGINSGGAPWVVREGHASISPDGRIQVEVQGLLLASSGTTGPVTMVGATLVCGGTGGTPVAVANNAVTPSPLSSSGGAQIEQTVTLPAACFGPVVLIRAFNASAPLGSQLGVFIAMTGLAPGQGQNQNQNGDDRGRDGHGE